MTSPLYPFLFTLTDGRIVNVGPDTVTRTITPGTWTWNTVATSSFDGGSAVMYRPDKIMKSGSYTDPDFTGADLFQTTNQTAVLDMTQASPTWRNTAPMATGRGYHVLTMLPDGQVLVTGGETASDGRDLTKSARPPSSGTRRPRPGRRWPRSRTGASTTRPRCCSPTAACSSPAAARRRVERSPIS